MKNHTGVNNCKVLKFRRNHIEMRNYEVVKFRRTSRKLESKDNRKNTMRLSSLRKSKREEKIQLSHNGLEADFIGAVKEIGLYKLQDFLVY